MNNHPTPTEPAAAAPSAKRFVMPAVVFGFLGAHMLFIFVAISLAVGDRSFAVVPDYYQKAVDWDDHKQVLADSAALGWSVQVIPSREVSVRGERELAVVLHDRDGSPIEDAEVNATLYPHARASQVAEVALPATDEPGRYAAPAQMRRDGVWSIALHVTRGDATFVHEEKPYVRGTFEGGGQ